MHDFVYSQTDFGIIIADASFFTYFLLLVSIFVCLKAFDIVSTYLAEHQVT
jgi:hypothetical protein